MIGGDGRWPVALVTRFLGSGKTTYIRSMLEREALPDTLVVVNEFGEIGIDHHLIAAVHEDVLLLRGGRLCRELRQDLARTLRDVHLRSIVGNFPPFAKVVVETSGAADPAGLVATLRQHPFVNDAYALRTVTTCVDGQHGLRQLVNHPLSQSQIAIADRLLITKTDIAKTQDVDELLAVLNDLNGSAEAHLSPSGAGVSSGVFETSATIRIRHTPEQPIAGHRMRSTVLSCKGEFVWSELQRMIAHLLGRSGSQILRLKGIIRMTGQDRPLVIQAVRHSFYPLSFLPSWPSDLAESTLVLIHSGTLPDGLSVQFAACRVGTGSHSPNSSCVDPDSESGGSDRRRA